MLTEKKETNKAGTTKPKSRKTTKTNFNEFEFLERKSTSELIEMLLIERAAKDKAYNFLHQSGLFSAYNSYLRGEIKFSGRKPAENYGLVAPAKDLTITYQSSATIDLQPLAELFDFSGTTEWIAKIDGIIQSLILDASTETMLTESVKDKFFALYMLKEAFAKVAQSEVTPFENSFNFNKAI